MDSLVMILNNTLSLGYLLLLILNYVMGDWIYLSCLPILLLPCVLFLIRMDEEEEDVQR